MIECTLTVPGGSDTSDWIHLPDALQGMNVVLEEMTPCLVETDAAVAATSGALQFSRDGSTSLPYFDDNATAVSFKTTATTAQAIRIRRLPESRHVRAAQMPSKSKKQHNFMEAVAHDPEFARKAGVSQKVGKDFADADKKSGKFGGKGSKKKK